MREVVLSHMRRPVLKFMDYLPSPLPFKYPYLGALAFYDTAPLFLGVSHSIGFGGSIKAMYCIS